MQEIGFLNSDIADALSRLGHMDELIVCDAGFPIPLGVRTIDISLKVNQPTVAEVLIEILKYFSVEKIVLAQETAGAQPHAVRPPHRPVRSGGRGGDAAAQRVQAAEQGGESGRADRRFHRLFQYPAGLRRRTALVC